MTRRSIHGIQVECVQGDITEQEDCAVVVNAANAQLRPGGGVAGAIHRAAGPELDAACRELAPIRPGEAVLTGAYELPNMRVIHCLGPVYGRDEPSEGLLSACYRNALQLAEEHGLESIVFPAISTGAFGFPLREAAEIAMQTIAQVAPSLRRLGRIRFALFGRRAYEAHVAALERWQS